MKQKERQKKEEGAGTAPGPSNARCPSPPPATAQQGHKARTREWPTGKRKKERDEKAERKSATPLEVLLSADALLLLALAGGVATAGGLLGALVPSHAHFCTLDFSSTRTRYGYSCLAPLLPFEFS